MAITLYNQTIVAIDDDSGFEVFRLNTEDGVCADLNFSMQVQFYSWEEISESVSKALESMNLQSDIDVREENEESKKHGVKLH